MTVSGALEEGGEGISESEEQKTRVKKAKTDKTQEENRGVKVGVSDRCN